ncbi:Innexin inx3 [Cryptotermes secundus]|nr:innexin inx3 isoform X2 [Cryptotermes secundus]XP_023709764.1 innexin inx3 isoform X2 [Cryptotermes secundus]PNF31403.1 Innexin inx3 [Cryptotermes secundus]
MLGVLKELKSWVKVSRRSSDHVSVDTLVSALHHRITFAMLLICCALLTSRQYFGDPILCIQDSSDDDAAIPNNVLNTYCFVTSSYTVVGPTGETWQGQGDAQRRHAYYQWMPFVLFLQSLLFASPHAAWCNWEGGLVRGSLMGLKDEVHGPNRDKLRTLARYFAARLHTFHIWAAGFYVCQLLNLLNVVINMFFTDKLLGGNFYEYGLQLRQYDLQTLERSPTDVVFPKLTKCLFRKYGPSGTIQIHDALCVMALNVVNEKIFMVLWYWFALLALVSGLALLWRLLILGLLVCASAHSHSFMSVLAQRALGTPVTLDPVYLSPVTQRLDCGDWLFLQLLGANMGTRVYREFMEQLVQAMEQAKQSDLQPLWNS